MTSPHNAVDVVVVGGGPAGMTATLVLARARRRVLLVDDGTYRNAQVQEFHGFPGRNSTDPALFRSDGRAELDRYGVAIETGPVVTAADAAGAAALTLADGRTVKAQAVLLATGVANELPRIEGLTPRWGRSVFNCPFCDGLEHRDHPVVLLDAAPGAHELATMLRHWTSQVEVIATERVRRLIGEDTALSGVETTDGALIPAEAIFVRSPVNPRSALAVQLGCEADKAGYVITDVAGATSHPTIWAAGDVSRPPPLPHQVVLAAADGSAAAISIHKALTE